jgi:hypothetical protein
MISGYDNKEFVASQMRQRECLEEPSQVDWSHLEQFDILGAVGKVVNPRPTSWYTGIIAFEVLIPEELC